MEKPQYLVSKGIVNLLRNRYELELSDKAEQRISGLESEFTDRLGEELSETFNYETISAKEIEGSMEQLVKRVNGLPIIQLDDIYFRGIEPDASISITRLVNDINDFSKKTLGPRKGYEEVESQIGKITDKYANRKVSIMDIGVFEGETMLHEEKGIIPLLKKNNVDVQRVYLSIVNKPARQKFEDAGLELLASKGDYDFTGGDWLEVRDLLGLDGRKINPEKYDINNGTHLFARYIQDPTTLKSGANIQDGVTAAIVLDLCNMYQKKILREIRKDGYQVKEGFVNSDDRLYTLEFSRKNHG